MTSQIAWSDGSSSISSGARRARGAPPSPPGSDSPPPSRLSPASLAHSYIFAM